MYEIIVNRLKHRDDTEHEQVITKSIMGLTWLAYILWVDKYNVVATEAIMASIYYLVVTMMIFFWVKGSFS